MRLLPVASGVAVLLISTGALAQSEQSSDPDQASGAPLASPTGPAPSDFPPPPPAQLPPPPAQDQWAGDGATSGADQTGSDDSQGPVVTDGQPDGQWVFTDQYGWVWIPYGSAYTDAPATADATPYSFVYYPVSGWLWLPSPWIVGWGACPYFGAYGAWRYSWYRPGAHWSGNGWAGNNRPSVNAPVSRTHPIAPVGHGSHPVAPVSHGRAAPKVVAVVAPHRPPPVGGR